MGHRDTGLGRDVRAPGMWLIAYSMWGRASSTTALPLARIRFSSSVLTSGGLLVRLPERRLMDLGPWALPALAAGQRQQQSGHRHRRPRPEPRSPCDHGHPPFVFEEVVACAR